MSRPTSSDLRETTEMKLDKIRTRIAEGFYLSRKVYAVIAEKVLKEILAKK